MASISTSINSKKKKNYTDFEIDLLTELVQRKSGVIENKTTNASMISKKDNAWDTLSKEFNATIGISNQRTTEQLRKKWSLMKSLAHKDLNKEKRSRYKTGGGCQENAARNVSVRIASFLASQANPLSNPHDNDAEYFIDLSEIDNSQENGEVVEVFNAVDVMDAIAETEARIEQPSNHANDIPNETAATQRQENNENGVPNQSSALQESGSTKRKAMTLQQRAIEFATAEHEVKMKILKAKLERESQKSLEGDKTLALLEAQLAYWTAKNEEIRQ